MANKIWGSNNEPLKIQFITDTHYYSRKGGTEGKAYDKAESKSQKVIKDSDLVIKAGFDMLCEDKSTDIVVLAGDTTRDGEIESHKEFIEMLRDLKKEAKEFMLSRLLTILGTEVLPTDMTATKKLKFRQ